MLLLLAGITLRDKLFFFPTRLTLWFVFIHTACVRHTVCLFWSFAYILLFSACEHEIMYCRLLPVKVNKRQSLSVCFSFPCCVVEVMLQWCRAEWGQRRRHVTRA